MRHRRPPRPTRPTMKASTPACPSKKCKKYEPVILIKAEGNNAYLSTAKEIESGAGFEVVATAASTGDTFKITRSAEGVVKRTCAAGSGSKGCLTKSW